MTKGLYLFTSDQRLNDNLVLNDLLMSCDQVCFVYIVDPLWFKPINLGFEPVGPLRLNFIQQSLSALANELAKKGHKLYVLHGDARQIITDIVLSEGISHVAIANQTGWFEQRMTTAIMRDLPHVSFTGGWNHTLFEPSQLNLHEQEMRTFSRFRKYVEAKQIGVRSMVPAVSAWPEALEINAQRIKSVYLQQSLSTAPVLNSTDAAFTGGEHQAIGHLSHYFNRDDALTYKQTRNALDEWCSSTKFSPWLSIGNLSPVQIWHSIDRFEKRKEANDSTYWIGFELLWREYFQWMASIHTTRLFSFSGLSKKPPEQRFCHSTVNAWAQGTTEYPLINACMRQLNATGYLSNRGRQIAASCLINELGMDWRYGAAYFQQQLLDYDVASNWGNWQYIAGVGADPRGGRHFNLEKQQAIYDPKGVYIERWGDRNTGFQDDTKRDLYRAFSV